ncbi:NAD(P)-binding protein [Exidia glandulosa HHB12029]|uniref:NAD(P)-binding protein n=1 Tax=Exidia glandulosa HHB12029 TaxID=1314781 RepID=A0A165IXH5_EXIGL|nr:NAD(P)-binding protein [Exidia glandulosa HHB12029]
MTVSSDLSAPLVVVIGATGVQGGSVVRNLVQSDKPYRLRGLTRDVSKPAAQELAELGVEVVSANIVVGNESGVQEAFHGADIVFGVTNFWEHMDASREIAEGKLMVDSAKAVGVKLFIFSGLPHVTKLSGGKFSRVAHLDSKAEIVEYARSQIQTVDVQAGYYMTNLTAPLLAPEKQQDGTYIWTMQWNSTTAFPFIDMEADYGLFVRYAIESPEYNKGGGTIYSYGEHASHVKIASILKEVRGITIQIVTLDADAYRTSLEKAGVPPAGLEIFGDLVYVTEFGLYFGKELENEQRKVRAGLARKPRTFEEFLRANPDFLAA